MKLKHLLCCGAAIAMTASAANAATINLVDTGGVTGSAAEKGFKIAALYWGSVLTNNVTINLGVGFAPLAPRVIGSTGSTRSDITVSAWEAAVNRTKSGSLLDQTAILPTLNTAGGATFITNGVDAAGNDDTTKLAVDIGNTTSSKVLYMNTSVEKAVGLYKGAASALDGNVQFSSNFGFDFDPTNGISDNTFDFIGVAIHEIGHALGFVSGVDFLDYYGGPNGPGKGVLGYSLNDTSIYSALDMFRYSKDPSNMVSGTGAVQDLSVGTASYFSIDGGKTALFGNTFSTGAYNGDGSQASHWKDTANTLPGCPNPQLGIMDPTFCYGQTGEVTALDLAAFDAMGWNTSVDALRNPGYRLSTAGIFSQFSSLVPEPSTWAMMLTGFAMMAGALRGRRRATVKVAFQG